mgnify:CR=1 FL=1
MTGLPRTLSGDLSSLQRRKSESHASSSSPLPPPPPSFPAPIVPDDDRSSLLSGHSSASSNRTGKHWDCMPGKPVLMRDSVLEKPKSQNAHMQLRLYFSCVSTKAFAYSSYTAFCSWPDQKFAYQLETYILVVERKISRFFFLWSQKSTTVSFLNQLFLYVFQKCFLQN